MDQPTNSLERVPPLETTLWLLVALTLLIMPFAFMRPALDAFRIPKDVFFQTMALLIFSVGTIDVLFSDRSPAYGPGRQAALLVAATSVFWTGMTSLTSVDREVSFFKPLSVFCFAVFFVVSMRVARRRDVWALGVVIVPALINSVVAFFQSTGVQAFILTRSDKSRRLETTGLIGNPNELGGYLVLPMIAAIAAAIAWPRLRWLFAAAALVLAGGIVASQSVTPLIATAAGIAATMALPRARVLRRWAIAILVLLVVAVSVHPGSRQRMKQLVALAQAGTLSELTSFRLPAYGVAWKMFAERPLLGVGPGGFSAAYMPYKVRLDEVHPEWIRIGNQNFGEVHNDHLQLLAETGVFGYGLFLAALVLLARISFTGHETSAPRQRFARAFAFPAVAAFFVLALAHFPMQLTSTVAPAVYLSALCFAWMDADEVA